MVTMPMEAGCFTMTIVISVSGRMGAAIVIRRHRRCLRCAGNGIQRGRKAEEKHGGKRGQRLQNANADRSKAHADILA